MYDGRAGVVNFPFDELKPMWTWIWDYPLDKALEEATASLTSQGIFKDASH